MCQITPSGCRNCLTGVVVEEPVLSPENLRWLHDDGLRKLIPHCSLPYSLERE